MLNAYVNYPNAKVSVHGDDACAEIGKMRKQHQRHVRIDAETIATEFQKFSAREYTFAAHSAGNDMWLQVDFSDQEFESAVISFIHTYYRQAVWTVCGGFGRASLLMKLHGTGTGGRQLAKLQAGHRVQRQNRNPADALAVATRDTAPHAGESPRKSGPIYRNESPVYLGRLAAS